MGDLNDIKLVIDELRELREVSKENREKDHQILAEVRQLAERIAEIRGELKGYRMVMHERMNRIHDILISDEMRLDDEKATLADLDKRISALEAKR
jgi:hypothetical protein